MPGKVTAGLGFPGLALLGAALVWAPAATSAASFDCNARGLSRAETTICEDAQLSRSDEQLARKLDSFARRINYGQYLGLRHWQAQSVQRRNLCGIDRVCIGAYYRAQMRFLERLQQCLDNSLTRRTCLRNMVTGDREALKR